MSIEFRAWKKPQGDAAGRYATEDELVDLYLSNDARVYQFTPNPKLEALKNVTDEYEIEFWTNTTDRKGIKVYQGDKVNCWKKQDTTIPHSIKMAEGYATAIIEFNGWEFKFNQLSGSEWFFYGPEERAFFPEGGLNPDYEWIEVIGNIKENQGLFIPKGQKV